MSNVRQAVERPLDADPGMNMTPMIDITFQLIVFFLLTLQFTAVEHRLDASLPPVGEAPTQEFRERDRPITISLFRRVVDERALTRVKIAGVETIELPSDRGQREVALERVFAAIERVRDRAGTAFKGEIKAPPPTGGSVPHGDVIAVLDQMIRARIDDIAFEGAAPPLSSR